MSSPYVGEIRLFAGNFAPVGWAFCDGSIQSIANNETLFNLIGTTYGGDGQSTFALPNLSGRFPLHQGTGQGAAYVMGQSGGAETVAVTVAQLPAHSHQVATTAPGTANVPASTLLLSDQAGAPPVYAAPNAATLVALAGQSVGATGGGQGHDNMHPYLAVNFIISLFGVYPSQN